MQFKDVIGQEELKRHLIDEVKRDRISHAQLFLGNSGHGNLPLVLAFSQYIFCSNKSNTDSCGVCDSCRKVRDLQHPDLHFSFPVVLALDKKSAAFLPQWRAKIAENPYFSLNQWSESIDPKGRRPIIGTEESMEIIKKLSLKSYEGDYKIMVIWMTEEMNAACANKLLKILEEPTPKTLFFLIADSQENMLQTIISRTQLVKVPRLNIDDIRGYLTQKMQLDSSTATSIAAQSEGNLIDAIDLAAENSKSKNRENFIQLMRVCYKKDVIPMMDWAQNMSETGKEQQKVFLRYALHMFRQSLLRNYTEDQLTKTSKEEDQFLQNFAKFITGNNIHVFMENFNDAYYHIERNANPKILFTELCFKVMRYIHFA
jgi:DNA polymerase-3 subunit delta'